jgi:tRNA (Thr-GGU) A37 N-methylase
VKLISIQDNVLTVEDIDILDGTPVLDIKPYSPTFDMDEIMRFGWIANTNEQK